MKTISSSSRYLFAGLFLVISALSGSAQDIKALEQEFRQPPMDCRPHTRWWWMGNALSREDITRQLDAMCSQGIGGVEQITMPPVYTKGNQPYLSPEYFELLKFAVEEARDRNMEFSLNFGGPGWIWGGEWVPPEDQSKVMLASALTLEGPRSYSGPLSEKAVLNPLDLPRSTPVIGPEDMLLKVVAAQMEEGRLKADSLTEITAAVRGRTISWEVPSGTWEVMAFWLTRRDNANAVDHLNEGAMHRYCDALGAQYTAALGEHFGRTVESFFGDSFEVPIFRNGIYWTDGLFDAFKQVEGYDLVPWLPALWREVDDLSPKVRYDVNHFLHRQGMKAFFGIFGEWCKDHNVHARVQPYGFVTDILEGAGAADIPEMEITPGEKDAVPWLDTRIGPREYVASGAHLYGRQVVSTEAFTFLHHEPYRATPLELKIASDGYLRAGANKFYNHGFIASPERDIVPARGFFEAIRISPENIWWPYYHCVAEYTARCCRMLREGNHAADVAVYSPLANQWTLNVFNARRWTRDFDWGGLQGLLCTNGYAFDLLNDDVLQNHSGFEGELLHAGAMTYRVLVLPDIGALPVESYRKIAEYARQGGRVIALERTPEAATGMKAHEANDAETKRLSSELFDVPANDDDNAELEYGQGRTYFLRTVMHRDDPLDYRSAAFDPFVKTLGQCVPPDLAVDLPHAGQRTNEGLVFLHRHGPMMDLYFLANIQHSSFHGEVGFRVTEGQPCAWDPHSGLRRPLRQYRREGGYTRIPLTLAPYESRLLRFEQTDTAEEPPHLIRSGFTEVTDADENGFQAWTSRNGVYPFAFFDGSSVREASVTVTGLPSVYEVNGNWRVRFEGIDLPARQYEWSSLPSWTDIPELRHFSGKGRYTLDFELPQEYESKDIRLLLDLGDVGTVAEIRLNGKEAGIHWRPGQEFDITGTARTGVNTLEVDVTNTLINRVSGLTGFPEIDPELQPRYGAGCNPPGDRALSLIGFKPLPPSGLLGPVRIIPEKRTDFYPKAQ